MTDPEPMRVVVVDDNPLFRCLLVRWIIDMGHDAVAVEDGLSALECIREGKAQVVVSDMMMPGMSGLELCRYLRKDQERRALYFLLITGDDTKERMREAWDVGVDDFLLKPISKDALASRLRIASRMNRLEAEVERRTRLTDERVRLSLALKEQERLVAVIAHELRTPLGGIRMVSDIFQMRQSELPAGLDKAAGMLQQQVLGMVETIENLLATSVSSDRGVIQWKPFDVPSTIREAVASIDHLRPLGVTIALRLPESLSMLGDQERVRRLVVNLLNNAVRHVRKGFIDVSLRKLAEDQVELCVQDNGEGISPKVLSVLGEPLLLNSSNLDADRQARGSGLGLAVCKEIVARHSGSLFIESAVGIGTRIRAILRSNHAVPSPVRADDCLYASVLPCQVREGSNACHDCSEECLFRKGGI